MSPPASLSDLLDLRLLHLTRDAPRDLGERAGEIHRASHGRRGGSRSRAAPANERFRCRGRIVSPSTRMTARSMQFCSSRTLPGQRYVAQLLHRRRREHERLLVQVAAEALDEVPREHRDVARPLAQRRNRDRKHRQPEIEVLAEAGAPPRRPSGPCWSRPRRARPPGRRAFRRRARTASPRARAGSWPGGGSGRSPISSRKSVPRCASSNLPGLRPAAPGERPLLVAEELGLEQRLGNRRAVDRDEGPVGPRAQRVQRAREELLAGAALAFEQHGRVGRRGAMQGADTCRSDGSSPMMLRRAAPLAPAPPSAAGSRSPSAAARAPARPAAAGDRDRPAWRGSPCAPSFIAATASWMLP